MTNALILALVTLILLVIACLLAWSAPSMRRDVAAWTSSHSTSPARGRAEPAAGHDGWLAAHDAKIRAETLREFAQFVLSPKHPGLDEFTLAQVAMEAEERAIQNDLLTEA